MSISPLGALRLANYPVWKATVRAALTKGGSIAGALKVLNAREHTVSRAVLFGWLREHPDVVDGLDLPSPKGLPRGEARQDFRPGWSPDDKNLARRNRRHGVSTKAAP